MRSRAAEALGELGEAAATPEVVSALVQVFTDESHSLVRGSAAEALGKLSEAAATAEVVSVLVRAVADDADSYVRRHAAEALGKLSKAAATSEAVSVLVRAVTDDADSGVGSSAAQAIIALQNLKPGWRIFERAMGSRYHSIRVSALVALPSPDPVTGIIGHTGGLG